MLREQYVKEVYALIASTLSLLFLGMRHVYCQVDDADALDNNIGIVAEIYTAAL